MREERGFFSSEFDGTCSCPCVTIWGTAVNEVRPGGTVPDGVDGVTGVTVAIRGWPKARPAGGAVVVTVTEPRVEGT